MSSFWSLFIIVIAVTNIIGCLWILQWNSRVRGAGGNSVQTTGHTWDGDLQEYNNRLPMWWLILFWLTGVFAAAYLAIYPGLGKFPGAEGWTAVGQYTEEMQAADARYAVIFGAFAQVPVAELAKQPEARSAGRNLFLNNCAVCHGSDGRGAIGFPNLADSDWLFGGTPDDIVASLTNGRVGVMPALGAVLGEQGTSEVIAYITAFSGKSTNGALAEAGKVKFQQFCSACHGADAKGNQTLGAPNLTDNIWLFGGTPADIRNVIDKGRTGQMPAQLESLGAERLHTLAAYVFGLSAGREPVRQAAP